MEYKVKAQDLPDAGSLVIDREHYYRQVLHGYYNFDCVVNDHLTRSAKFYVPENSVYNQPTVFIAVPDGRETYGFLVESGWKQMADERGLYIVMMEPAHGGWKDTDEEAAYITALNEDVNFRPFFCAFSSNFYGVGYGESAAILGRQSRKCPKCWAGVALLGRSSMEEDEAEALDFLETRVPGVKYSQVQMPVWITAATDGEPAGGNPCGGNPPNGNPAGGNSYGGKSDVQNLPEERLVQYYRKANHSMAQPRCSGSRRIYYPEKGGTIDEHWCSLVVIDKRDWRECLGFGYSSEIYDTVFKGVYRYPGNLNGALRRNPDIRDRGFQKFSAKVAGGFCQDKSDVYTRQWWVYVPKTVDQSAPFPAVFVFHGAGGSGDEIADRSGWSYVAEKYGFLILCPGASVPNRVRRVSSMVTNEMFRSMWNTGNAQADRPSDMLFVDYLYQWLTSRYHVDKSRIYASGQSSGGMMSWACAAYRPDYFAASAPVSAKIIDIESENPNPPVEGSVIPVMTNLGLEDNMFKGGYGTMDAKYLIDHWCGRFGLEPGWEGYTYDDGGKKCSFREGLFTNYIFKTKKGVPILRCVEAAAKGHAVWPTECEMAWTEWFARFSKDPVTKELYYNGEKVII